MTEVKGTPITRGGGYLIRVGWDAVGYSVERGVESRYRNIRAVLFFLALFVGIGVAVGAEYIFFQYAAPFAKQYVPAFVQYPEVFRLLIYSSTLFFGWLVYWQIRARVGQKMVQGNTALDEGYSFMEQRRRGCCKRKRTLGPLIVILLLILFVPHVWGLGLQLFLIMVVGFFLMEGLYFKFISSEKLGNPRKTQKRF